MKLLLSLLLLSNVAFAGKILDLDFKRQAIDSNKLVTRTPFKNQHTQVWCWAATSAMVIQHKTGRYVEDCSILSSYFQTNCCQWPQQCMRPGSPIEMSNILQAYGVPNQFIRQPLDFQGIVQSINRDAPLIAGLDPVSQGVGHVVVIVGYENDGTVYVHDPSNYQGFMRIHYNQLFRYGQMGLVWRATHVIY